MNKYSEGKIYKVVNSINDDFYIGSTTVSLSRRMACHRQSAKVNTSTLYMKMREVGIKYFSIQLITYYPCSSLHELFMKEDEYIHQLKPCLNMHMNISSDERKEELRKNNREKHKVKINERNLAAYYTNKIDPEFISKRHEINKTWRERNVDYDKTRKREWGTLLYHCDVCNCDMKRYCKTQHERSDKHLKYISESSSS